METRRKQSISGDGFSFPSTPEPDNNHHSRGSSSDFEFGSITPDSPYSDDPSKNSPADHLFFNGKLLPHSSDQIRYGGGSKAVSAQVYGSSQRWQFMAHPVPALSRDTSLRRRKTEVSVNNKNHNDEERRSIPKKKKKRTVVVKRLRFGRTPRIFRWFFAACRECHAIEPSKKKKS
ncbi:hypothetical protein F8388_006472 [Cannabis sativa]|uniref:Uncharacterized protein n=1 Tax=Cannabis sativa TaxID=3483 RepID=A0A7J6F916_CANSA|nr:hypothetical protein F8388_006472 [Cannabis sativa]KAF4400138.1 hypothetical protein G4B88_021352 [Cannabis sativa]